MFWYRQYIFIASSFRQMADWFIGKSLCIKSICFQIKGFILITIIFASACREPFDSGIRPEQTNYLVVEGFINAVGSTTITLSRTLPLKDTSKLKPEIYAQVKIEGEDNSVYNVSEKGSGIYSSDSCNLNRNQKYRLHITAGGKDYLSAFVPVKITPLIDSVSWKPDNGGVHIYVNTHDAQNKSIYYKWDYEETWEIHSAFGNSLIYSNGFIYNRPLDEIPKLYYCWGSRNSTNITLASSRHLSSDIISEAPIVSIPPGSEKISVRYSILVKQTTLDRQGYEFYQLMKKNTESIGSVFDALPSENAGNIVCVSNPSEKAIGYIVASTAEQKRIFILPSEIPQAFYRPGCYTIYVDNHPDSIIKYFNGAGFRPYQCDGCPFAKGYYSSTPECIDCRERGSSEKPSFW